jgi:membrane protein DedA with SNARE-associated domain
MSEKIIGLLVWLIGSGVRGYASVVVLMAVQSACIPIPSEVIMPLAGVALVQPLGMTPMQVQMQLVLLATVASLASNLGSVPAYWAGARGGRPMVERYGRWVLLSRRDLDRVDHFFAHYGSITVLVGRMLPIIRTFIAFPAGVAKMNQVRFHIYTFVGSWPWCYALAYVGMRLGASWNSNPQFKEIFHRFHLGVEAALAVGLVWFVVSHWRGRIRAEAA